MQTVTKAAKNKYLRNKLTYYYEIHPLQKASTRSNQTEVPANTKWFLLINLQCGLLSTNYHCIHFPTSGNSILFSKLPCVRQHAHKDQKGEVSSHTCGCNAIAIL